jgi:hypothetical protein
MILAAGDSDAAETDRALRLFPRGGGGGGDDDNDGDGEGSSSVSL